MSKVLIDLMKISDLNCGLGQFSKHLYNELIALDKELLFYAGETKEIILDSNFVEYKKWHRVGPIYRPRVDVWHAIHQDVKVYPTSSKIKKVLTILDLNFLEENKDPDKQKKYLANLQKKIDAASVVTTISHFSKSQIEKYLDVKDKRVEVIYCGHCLDHCEGERPQGLSDDVENFIFSLGTVVPKKNYSIILDIVDKREDLTFVVGGTLFHHYAQNLLKEVKERGLEKQVIFLGEISENEKRYLYEHAALFFHPSYLEGFGLPVVESFALGTPVVSSNRCSLPEVTGGHAYLFDPDNVDEATQAIDNCLSDISHEKIEPNELKDFVKQFSWDKLAVQYYNLYQDLA